MRAFRSQIRDEPQRGMPIPWLHWGKMAYTRGALPTRVPRVIWTAVLSLLSICVIQTSHAQSTAADDDAHVIEAATASAEKQEAGDLSQKPDAMDFLALADAPIFLPRSYLYWGSPTGPKWDKQPLVFALEYALHLPAYNDLRRKALLGKTWAGAATLSFEGNLRMLAEESKPVRMPSYRPSISGQVFYLWHLPYPVLFGLRAGMFHFSNGQEGCTFDASEKDTSDACRAGMRYVENPSRELNRRTGNFATNGFLLDVDARVHRLNRRGVAVSYLRVGFGMAGNFRTDRLGMERGLRKLYGWGPISGRFEMRHLLGRAALTVRAEVSGFPKSGRHVPRASGSLEVVVSPDWLTSFGFFVRYYGGRDFYNAFFVDAIQQFSTGLAWDGERPLKFGQPR